MEITKEKIIDALRFVNYPELQQDIVALNMIEEIGSVDKKISVTLKFPKINDPFASSIRKACEKAIKSAFGEDVSVEIFTDFAKKLQPEGFNSLAGVKNIIAISSGKGGVGKSTIAVNLSVAVANTGAKVGLLDADVYGPSIPMMFAADGYRPEIVTEGGQDIIEPLFKYGVKILSLGFFVKSEDAMIWRGPMATKALKQLISQTNWGTLDYLFIDLPPGTGDIHLTMVQEMAVTGAVIVSTPQDVSLADVIKGIALFESEKIKVPLLGLIENMSWFTPKELPGNKYYIFGKNGCKTLAEKLNIPLLGQIPLIQSICENGDHGTPSALDISSLEGEYFEQLAEKLVFEVDKRNSNLTPTQKVQIQ